MEDAANKPSFWALPTSAKDSGSLALWLTVVLEGFFIALARSADPFFYWCLKVAFPVCAGCLAALIYARREPRDFRECTSAAMRSMASLYISLAVLAALFLPMLGMYTFNIEYVNYVVAALVSAPFTLGLAYLGGWVGYKLQAARWRYIG